MSFTFNTGVPNANNDPAVDQPDMLQNNISTDGILAVDHVTFNTANGGTHKFIQFKDKLTPGAPTGDEAALYSLAGTASTNPQCAFQNADAILPMSLVRAYARVTPAAGGAGTIVTGYNVTSITGNGPGTVQTIVLATGCTTGDNIAVLFTAKGQQSGLSSVSWSYSNPTLTITNVGSIVPDLSFLVLQF